MGALDTKTIIPVDEVVKRLNSRCSDGSEIELPVLDTDEGLDGSEVISLVALPEADPEENPVPEEDDEIHELRF